MRRRWLTLILALMLCATGFALADEAALLDIYDLISPLGNGLYAVRRDGLWGIADEGGAEILAPMFTREPEFEDGLAVVSTKAPGPQPLEGDGGELQGVIDETGRVRIPFEYDQIELSGAAALAWHGEEQMYVDLDGNAIPTAEYDSLWEFVGEYATVAREDDDGWRQGVIDRTGAEVVPLEFAEIKLSEHGPAAACRFGEEQYGYIDMRGEFVIEPAYGVASPFREGVAVVASQGPDAEDAWSDGIDWGLIDERGSAVLPLEYDSITWDEEGRIEAKRGEEAQWFAVRDGELTEIEAPGEEIYGYDQELEREARGRAGDGGLFIERRDGRWRLTDAAGTPVTDYEFLSEPVFADGCAAVGIETDNVVEGASYERMYERLWGAIDEAGAVRIPFEYDALTLSDGIALAREGDDYLYLTTDGAPLNGERYDHADPFRGGYAVVGREVELTGDDSFPFTTLWGAIDRTGALVVPCEYEMLELGDGGTALVQLSERGSGGGYGYIGMDGEFLFDARFDAAEPFIGDCALVATEVERASDGGDSDSSPVARDWGMIDRTGKLVLPMEYDEIAAYEGGLYRATRDGEAQWFRVENGAAEAVEPPV